MGRAARPDTQGKKTLYWQTRYGAVSVAEQLYRLRGKEVRPFSAAAGVQCRGYSAPLQRVLVDFGAEKSFGQAVLRVREHYGIEVPAGAVRQHTLVHGAALLSAQAAARQTQLGPAPGVPVLVTEMDGCLVPLVEIGVPAAAAGVPPVNTPLVAAPQRTRRLYWQEARLCLAHEPESVTPRYGVCLADADEAGAVWLDCVIRAGAGAHTYLHALGDGALWIEAQAQTRFGAQAHYHCDFYHVSDYLAAAAAALAGAQAQAWLRRAQQLLKENRGAEVLAELAPQVEAPEVAEEQAPVRSCWRYLHNRPGQLDYQGALAAGLPIGSGEVESSHRSVVQARLKISGAWWLPENAQKMLALRQTRANNEWQAYWRDLRQAEAGF